MAVNPLSQKQSVPASKAPEAAAPAAPVAGGNVSKPQNDAFGGGARTVSTEVPAIAAEAAPRGYGYSVKSGDTLIAIGKHYGVYPTAIAMENKIADPNKINAGQAIRIPGWGSQSVHAGDTLSGIARDHDTSWQSLAHVNELKDPNLLKIGQRLAVPTRDAGDVITATVAHDLGLGKALGSEGAAGTVYSSFKNGVVAYSNVTGKISSVEFNGPEGKERLEGSVVDAAMFNMLGKYKGSEGAAGHTYFTFEHGTVDFGNADGKVLGVTREEHAGHAISPMSLEMKPTCNIDISGQKLFKLTVQDHDGHPVVLSQKALKGAQVPDSQKWLAWTEATDRGFEGEAQDLKFVSADTGKVTTVRNNAMMEDLQQAISANKQEALLYTVTDGGLGRHTAVFVNPANGKVARLPDAKIESTHGDKVKVETFKVDGGDVISTGHRILSLQELLKNAT